MPMKPPDPEGRSSLFGRLRRRVGRSPAGRGWRRGSALELWQRSLGFAALGFLTLVPLLIVVSAADPANGQGFAQWLGEVLGVSAPSRKKLEQLIALPGQTLRTTTAYSLAALAVFGLSFGAAVQTTYEKIWGLPPARWSARWRHIVWLAALIGLLLLSSTTTLWRQTPLGGVAAVLSAILFLWWSQRLLLGGRVRWSALLPGAVATTVGLLGLRVFSRFVFSPLIATNTLAYGPIGTVLVIQSWLVGVGAVVYGGALAGRLLHDEYPRVAGALKRRR
ncbi:YhjD/YihY/BrkB family envelope integrity protein [Kitasatospora sp. NPDC051705]|uniref:YhjD/YihY/BrkB family envelope integrity protein n=1 Tax=Kitasatospora sp. NPDC051705 TaxID=3364057 RepID=UPI0037B3C762